MLANLYLQRVSKVRNSLTITDHFSGLDREFGWVCVSLRPTVSFSALAVVPFLYLLLPRSLLHSSLLLSFRFLLFLPPSPLPGSYFCSLTPLLATLSPLSTCKNTYVLFAHHGQTGIGV